MQFIHLIRRNLKGLIIAFVLLLMLPTVVFGAARGYEYMQAKSLISEARQLSVTGKYKEAIGKLNIAESKWSPKSTKDEIKQEVVKNNVLAESDDNFTQGTIQYEGENYKKAIEYFDKVIKDDEHYRTAQSYREIAEKNLNDKNESTPAQPINVVSQQEALIQPTSTPIPTLQPLPTENPNKDAICKNEASLGRIKFEEETSKIVQEKMPQYFSFEEAKRQNPGQYTSQYIDEYTIMKQWAKDSQIFLSSIYAGIKNEGEKVYYQLYNDCLVK